MRFTKFLSITSLIILLTFTSCDEFLTRPAVGSLDEVQLRSQAGLEGSLVGAYSMLLGRFGFYSGASNWFWGSVRGGDAYKGSDPGDQSQVNEIMTYATQTTNPSVRDKYRALFEGVARANATLRLASEPDPSVPTDVVQRIVGEARFLRGHYYFELKALFNDVPYVDETWDEVTPVPNNQSLWPFIEADFQAAFDNLPDTQGDIGRANKWAAASYLGKTFLFQGKYTEAKGIFDQVVASGVTARGEKYTLLPNYASLFTSTNDNNAESIFSVQAAANTGSTNNANPDMVLNFPHGTAGGSARPGGCCGFFQPSLELANSFRTVSGLPLLDGSYNDGANALTTDLGVPGDDPFTADAGELDPRIDHSIGRRSIPYLDWGEHPGFFWIRFQPYGGPYSPKKFQYSQAGSGIENDPTSWTPGYTAVNVNVIRYADVVLMLAEAEVELGNLEAARALVNQVRARAATSILMNQDGTAPAANYVCNEYSDPWTDQGVARLAVQMERKLELSGEGKRFMDLVRWHNNGTADISQILGAYIANDQPILAGTLDGATFDLPRDLYLPIPQDEVDLQNTEGSVVITQNPGY